MLVAQVSHTQETMDIEQELREVKFKLRSLEARAETLLESQAIVLKSLGRAGDAVSREEWLQRLKQAYQDKRNNAGA